MLLAIDSAIFLQTEVGVVEALRESFDAFAREAALQAPRLLAALFVFAAFFVIGLIVRRVLRAALGRAPMAPRIRLLVVRLVFFAILSLGAVALLGVATGASVGRLFAGFGLLSVGLGFALKSPLENMFSGILTILVSPFRIGDEIEVSGYAGRVETINIHDTVLRTFDGKRVAIPNVDVYLNAITNQTAYSERRYDVLVGIHYNDDMRRAIKVAREVLASTEGVRALPQPLVLVGEFGESSVNLILRFWADPTMQAQYLVSSEVTANVKLAFDEAGITIPFPIRTIHIPGGLRRAPRGCESGRSKRTVMRVRGREPVDRCRRRRFSARSDGFRPGERSLSPGYATTGGIPAVTSAALRGLRYWGSPSFARAAAEQSVSGWRAIERSRRNARYLTTGRPQRRLLSRGVAGDGEPRGPRRGAGGG